VLRMQHHKVLHPAALDFDVGTQTAAVANVSNVSIACREPVVPADPYVAGARRASRARPARLRRGSPSGRGHPSTCAVQPRLASADGAHPADEVPTHRQNRQMMRDDPRRHNGARRRSELRRSGCRQSLLRLHQTARRRTRADATNSTRNQSRAAYPRMNLADEPPQSR